MSRKPTSIRLVRVRMYFKLKSFLHELSNNVNASTKVKYKTKSFLERILLGNEYYISGFNQSKFSEVPHFENVNLPLIIIDGQPLRNSTFFRGIGRYILSLTKYVAMNTSNYNILLIFTNIGEPGNIPKVIEFIENQKLGNLKVQIFDVTHNEEFVVCTEASFRLTNEISRKKPKLVLIPSHFEHPLDCIPLFPTGKFRISVLIHDLIPLTFAEVLLPTKDLKRKYLERMKQINNYDEIYAVSEFTAQDIKRKVSENLKVHVINGAGFSETSHSTPLGFNSKRGILTVGAATPHKNIFRLIEAYSRLPIHLRIEHQLTIVGLPKEAERAHILEIAGNFGVEINVPQLLTDDELSSYYLNSRLVVVPSLAEGLSMPVMESWLANTVAVGGHGTVLEEVIGISNLLFDPYSSQDICNKMKLLLEDEEIWNHSLTLSRERLRKYNWNQVANNFLNSLYTEDSDHETSKT
jgi:glycosyltransferase involved in cell wall biosynthesis